MSFSASSRVPGLRLPLPLVRLSPSCRRLRASLLCSAFITRALSSSRWSRRILFASLACLRLRHPCVVSCSSDLSAAFCFPHPLEFPCACLFIRGLAPVVLVPLLHCAFFDSFSLPPAFLLFAVGRLSSLEALLDLGSSSPSHARSPRVTQVLWPGRPPPCVRITLSPFCFLLVAPLLSVIGVCQSFCSDPWIFDCDCRCVNVSRDKKAESSCEE